MTLPPLVVLTIRMILITKAGTAAHLGTTGEANGEQVGSDPYMFSEALGLFFFLGSNLHFYRAIAGIHHTTTPTLFNHNHDQQILATLYRQGILPLFRQSLLPFLPK